MGLPEQIETRLFINGEVRCPTSIGCFQLTPPSL